jgi:serine/threonine protein kinase
MSMIGKSLVHYEITAEIGKGGMGEVYQAKDTKLGRDVAIKVLPEEFALDTDRVARFQREAKLLASLNHPNIAAIYGLEESDGTHFLVMELIEGDTLRDRIKSGPIPVEEALKLALQMAEALEAAHEKGVIHRDLKPANIKVTPDGKIKILDFGLAKAYAGDQENIKPEDSPTISAAATQQGVILGTAAYMSPEQARGKPVDKRADIWAFGVVLFEMLTGKSLFSGEDVTSTVARVLEREPDFSTLPKNLHFRIQLLLERCLKKDPKTRYHDIADVRVDIQSVLADPSGVFVQPIAAAEPQVKLRTILLWAATTLVLGLIIAGVTVWTLRTPEAPKVIRFTYELPEDQQLFRSIDGGIHLAVSPDGSHFAYSTTKGIYIRSMSELNARLISGTDKDASSLFFSPNGQWLGYFSETDQKLKSISVSGGAPTDLCDSSMVYGAYWYEDNTIVYTGLGSGVCRIPAKGGIPEVLVERSMVAGGQFLPDDKSIMFSDLTSRPNKTMVQSLDTGDQKVVFESGGGFYLPTGHFIYGAEDNIFAVPFDPNKLEFTGGAMSVMETAIGVGYSDSGTLVYVPAITDAAVSTASTKRTLVWVSRDGKEEPLAAPLNDYSFCNLSPDGTKVALQVKIDGNEDIRIWDTVRKTLTRLTFDEAIDRSPLWTPDGQNMVFVSERGEGLNGVFRKKADGTGEVEELYSSPDPRIIVPFTWSGDGDTILLVELNLAPLDINIGTLSMEGDKQRKGLLETKHLEGGAQISPDGRWLAYSSNKSGQAEIYARPFPDVEKGLWQVSTSGGHSPLWSPDGREIFYRNGDATMVVPVDTDPTFSLGNPEILFRGTYFGLEFGALQMAQTRWDIHPDGDRFLMIKPSVVTEGESSEAVVADEFRKINIVLNWFEELKQRVPVD